MSDPQTLAELNARIAATMKRDEKAYARARANPPPTFVHPRTYAALQKLLDEAKAAHV